MAVSRACRLSLITGVHGLNRKALPFIIPFLLLMALPRATDVLGLPTLAESVARLNLAALALAFCMRKLPNFRMRWQY